MLAEKPHTTPEDIEAARLHLHALLGTVTLRPRDGVLWAHPAPNAKGLVETRPLDGADDAAIQYSGSIRKPSETRAWSPSHATSSPRKPEKDQELTQCGRYRENDRGLTKNSTSGGSDYEGFCVGDYLCFHHS